jgi:hypothetical protein
MSTTQDHSKPSHWQPRQVKWIDDKWISFRDVCVHEFLLSYVEDPDIYAAEPILKWQNSEAGQWLMAHANSQPYWIQHVDANTMGYRYKIWARLSEQNETFWRLRWAGIK